MEIDTHRSIALHVSRLSKEHPEWNLIDAFTHGGRLHINFYEDHLPADHVEESRRIIEKAASILSGTL